MDDTQLLQEYARTGTESAFAALVERHIGLVHSAAQRQVRDAQLAEDVTQAVFIILARKAGQVARHPGLSGWLLQTTRYAANVHIRGAARRAQREQEAAMQSELNDSSPDAWAQLEPHLDRAMASLGTKDRALLALRFYENKTASETASLLGLGEAATHKRTARALEKLRKFFSKHGVTLSVGAIATAVSTNAVQAAPAGMAVKVSSLAGTASVTTTIPALVKTTMKIMMWNNIKAPLLIGSAATLLVLAGATTLLAQQLGKPSEIPYKMMEDAYLFENSINKTNLVFHIIIESKNKGVNPPDIHLTIQSKTKGNILIKLGHKGEILNFPCDDDLRQENPPIVSDQPRGLLGAGIWVYVPVPEGLTFHYSHLVNAVEEANRAQDRAHQLSKSVFGHEMSIWSGKVDGVGLVFHQSNARKAKIVIATAAGPKEYVANADGVIPLKINPKLQAEDPLITVSERPAWIGVGHL